MRVVCYGGGTNSTAMLIGLHDRGERPDAILFADTGGEKPHTYEHVAYMSKWCVEHGFPPIVTVQSQDRDGNYYTLEEQMLERNALPGVAYGMKSCSEKHKTRPQTRWLRDCGMLDATKLVGFDADEPQRAKPYPNQRYPLIEWNWGRDECIEAIAMAGIPQPGKSACFFCPNYKKSEILDLKMRYPDLLARAIAMEDNAELTTIKGLGRNFAWKALVQFDADQIKMFSETNGDMPCECYEG